jgi:two-component system chemotaxis sensor kinase CheA
MNALLQQFISESRDFLQSISELLLQLEQSPQDQQIIVELFRAVHTLKGNSGLFEFTAMTQVLHAAEDLMDNVRDSRLAFSAEIADQLLDSMDFVANLLDKVADDHYQNNAYMSAAAAEAFKLRQLLANSQPLADTMEPQTSESHGSRALNTQTCLDALLLQLPSSAQKNIGKFADGYFLVHYQPEAECFFKGEDPFYLVLQLASVEWSAALASDHLPNVPYDCYSCQLQFVAVTSLTKEALESHFRFVSEQVRFFSLAKTVVTDPASSAHTDEPADVMNVLDDAFIELLDTQMLILEQQIANDGPLGIIASVHRTLTALQLQIPFETPTLGNDLNAVALISWTQSVLALSKRAMVAQENASLAQTVEVAPFKDTSAIEHAESLTMPSLDLGSETRFGRRAEDSSSVKVLKVEQCKIDRLMDLIGEIVVAKNALPYLANKAEDQFGNREMSREIKSQYAVINRIVEEMQDAIMQVRMMPVSFIFQRFPRLVRDIARKLNKEVDLQIHGEQTEADKTIVESLADPLIHILRNSLDHGLETVEERLASGKSAVGTLKIRANQEADRVVIVIEDDGRGINPAVVKRKAWEKKLISEDQLEKLTDQEAIQLIFAAGFSTVNQVTDLSGRGVGMDVVKTAVVRVGGSVQLSSELGRWTRLSLSLPLSMAVTNVMVVGSDQQIFGIPMDLIVETVRLPRSAVRQIKQQMTTILRGRIIPLRSLNQILAIDKNQQLNDEDEFALLVVKTHGEVLGLLVDDFFEVIDIILKPLPGELGKMSFYSGSALLGDGSVLLILNPQEFY